MNHHEYFLKIAHAVAERSSCRKRKCGAVIVVENHIVSTGYNGTPENVQNCDEGGCSRCADDSLRSGERFDECICAHAERNAIYFAARYGMRVGGGTLYSTLKPCLWCLEACIQAGIRDIVFDDDWPENYKAVPDYHKLAYKCNLTRHSWGQA